LQVYQLALGLADEISALIRRSPFDGEWELKRQMGDCSARIPSQIAEGYGYAAAGIAPTFKRSRVFVQ